MSQIGWKIAEIAFSGYRPNTEKNMSTLGAVLRSVSKAGENLSQIGWKTAEILFMAYRFDTEKSLFWEQFCD